MSRKQNEQTIKDWNAANPIGTSVLFRKTLSIPCEPVKTKTRSAAYLLGQHTPVVLVDGISGCVMLEACSVVREAPVRRKP